MGLINSSNVVKLVPKSIRDYIALPKANQYQSLHVRFIVDGEGKNSTEFFSSLDVGEDVVEAQGTLSGGMITWVSVELM